MKTRGMSIPSGDSFDGIFAWALTDLSTSPDFICAPRGSEIKEKIAYTMILENPRARILTCPEREANYGFGVGEFLWYWQGKNDLSTMLYYNKRMKDYSDDGVTVNSAYGYIMKGKGYTFWVDQWRIAQETLTDDPDSRRAIVQIHNPVHQSLANESGTKDVPCTLSLQFFIRDKKLHLHTVMRSNDVMWGLTYDLFSFTLFQECMLLELKQNPKFKDLELGTYRHTAGSLHLYSRHYELADKILEGYRAGGIFAAPAPMEPIAMDELERLCDDEDRLRKKEIDGIDTSRYTGGTRWMAGCLNDHRQKRDAEGLSSVR